MQNLGILDEVELCVLPDFKELLWEFSKSLVGSLRDGSAEAQDNEIHISICAGNDQFSNIKVPNFQFVVFKHLTCSLWGETSVECEPWVKYCTLAIRKQVRMSKTMN